MKNCEPFVFLPALAIERVPFFVCLSWKFSSKTGCNEAISFSAPPRETDVEYVLLTLELLAIDGLSTGTVAAGEVATLKHEVGDDTVERGTLVTETVLAGGELTEVTGSLGDDVVEELEGDATGRLVVNRDIELRIPTPPSMYRKTRTGRTGRRVSAGKRKDVSKRVWCKNNGNGCKRETHEDVGHGDEGERRKEECKSLEDEGSSLMVGQEVADHGHQHQDHPDSII